MRQRLNYFSSVSTFVTTTCGSHAVHPILGVIKQWSTKGARDAQLQLLAKAEN